jgi:hypothetical protein
MIGAMSKLDSWIIVLSIFGVAVCIAVAVIVSDIGHEKDDEWRARHDDDEQE